MSTYLRPTAPIAADALLTPNPAEAMALAQRLLVDPRMANHSHGLWGYSGPTPAGEELTIQSTGIGGPSAAAVLFELAAHGVRRAIRVARARPFGDGTKPHTSMLVAAALCGDGTSRALGNGSTAEPDEALTRALREALGAKAPEGIVLSRDVHPAPGAEPDQHEAALVADLETAATLAVGERAGVAVAAALVLGNGDDEASRCRLLALGDAGAAALRSSEPV